MVDIDSTTHRSILHSTRPPSGNPPTAIVLHSGEGESAANDIHHLTKTQKASSHYYVTRTGKVFQMVDDHREAKHAGPTLYLGRRNWNGFSLGIETEHRKGQTWPDAQRKALAELTEALIRKHGILRERVAAHRWVRRPVSAEHQDPTNFPDTELRAFIGRLYPAEGKGRLFRVTTDGSSVRVGAGKEHALVEKLNTDDVIEIAREVDGTPVGGNARWMERVAGLGFIHSSLLEFVPVDD